MEDVIKKLRIKGLVEKTKLSAYKILDYDLDKPDEYLQYLTDHLFDDLVSYMTKENMTQSDLAQKLGVSKQDVSKRFMGKNLTITWLLRAIRSIGGIVNLNTSFQDQKDQSLSTILASRPRAKVGKSKSKRVGAATSVKTAHF